jgi:hypothetical protein
MEPVQYNVYVERPSYMAYDEDDYTAGGAVRILCDCGYTGFVDADDDGHEIHGNCLKCDSFFRAVLS